MQQIRLWEITSDQKLAEIPVDPISLEERLEDWLASDIDVLDANLLVIGRQVETDFRGKIDLLCLDGLGNTVVIELKKERTPRDVTAQALEYASWVKNLTSERLIEIADRYFESSDALEVKFLEKFREELPSELNQDHRSLIVAEETDQSTRRIVRYLSEMSVRINVATVRHFKGADGREMLAQVYLIEPEVAEERARAASKRKGVTLPSLQAEADGNGIGEMFRRVREGTQGVLLARPYPGRVFYVVQLADGGQRTVLIVWSELPEEGGGMSFRIHATRFNEFRSVSKAQLLEWLPERTYGADVTGWSGSSAAEKASAEGLGGTFQSVEEVETFLAGLRTLRES